MMKRRAVSVKRATYRALFLFGLVAFTPYLGSGHSALRSVSGRVTDGSGAVMNGAVVQLRNFVTLQVRSYITQADGLYRFHGLHPLFDYNVRAQYEGRWSPPRSVSSFDSEIIVRINLQIPAQKPDKTIGAERISLPASGGLCAGRYRTARDFSTGKESGMCPEMTKSIDRWENEGGRIEYAPLAGGADNLTRKITPTSLGVTSGHKTDDSLSAPSRF